MRNKISIYRQYISFLLVVPLLILTLSVAIGAINYYLAKQDRRIILLNSAVKINTYITDNFKYILSFSQIVGNRISTQNTQDPEVIGKIFKKAYSIAEIGQDVATITTFDFIIPSGKVIASAKEGAIKNSTTIYPSTSNFIYSSNMAPWKLHIYPYLIKDIITDEAPEEYSIQVGFGITSPEGKFLGTISTKIDTDRLAKKIIKDLNDDSVEFLILTHDLKFVTASNIDYQENPYQIDFKSFKNTIHLNNVEYSIYKQVDNYPFVIFIGEKEYFTNLGFDRNILLPTIFSTTISILLLSLFLFFRNKLVIPVKELSDVANSISSGKADIKMKEYDAEEISNLALQLTKVRDYTIEINDMKLELENALAAKTEFLNNISHEIRTPIQGFTNISAGLIEHWNDFDDSTKFSLAKEITKNSKRMASLVGNLLDMSKFNSGNLLLEMHKFDLTSTINSIIDECETLYISDKDIKIIFDCETQADIIADQERIAQVLRNLFVNAIKFSPNHGVIKVELSSREIVYDTGEKIEGIYFSISDQGIGIPENEMNFIFTPFTQSSRSKTKAGGAGLGLSISKEIIEAHNGKIWAENNQDSVGSKFNFIIPTIQIHGHKSIAKQDIQAIESKPTNILIIDDENVCLLSMELLLRGTNYNLTQVSTAHAGLQYLEENPENVDLVLLDLMMPDMYGLNVISEIKKNKLLENIPIILQTGTSDQTEIEKAYEMGIARYIKKPYQKNLVLTEIAKALAQG